MNGKTIGKGHFVYINEEFERAAKAGLFKVETLNDMSMANIKKLQAGRLDAVVGSPETIMHYARELGIEDEIVLLQKPIGKRIPAYLVLSKQSPLKNRNEIAERLRQVLAAMWEDGTVAGITRRHVSPDKFGQSR